MIREHIIENFKNDDVDSIMDAITSSVNDQDEVVLPGLGVFFKLFWNEGDDDLKKKVAELVKKGLEQAS